MADENETAELSAEETAYFEAGGETEVKEAPITTEETTTETAESGHEDAGKVKTVPHQALHAEREEHKRTKAHLEELSRKQAVLEDRWNTLLKAGEKPAEQEETPPDPDVDIFAYTKWQAKQLDAMNKRLAERDQTDQQTRQQHEQEAAISQEWNRSVQEFTAQEPDFTEAAQYLASLRSKQLAALGMDQAGINANINNEVRGVVLQARQLGRSPAELIYAYAKVSGYTGKKNEAAEQIAKIDEAQRAAKTIAGSGGGAGGDALTADAIANMSQGEFDAWIQKPENERRFNRMMGA